MIELTEFPSDCDSKDLEVIELIRNRIDNYTKAKKAMKNFRIPTDSSEYEGVASKKTVKFHFYDHYDHNHCIDNVFICVTPS